MERQHQEQRATRLGTAVLATGGTHRTRRPGCASPLGRDARARPRRRPSALFSLPSSPRRGAQRAACAPQKLLIYVGARLSTELEELARLAPAPGASLGVLLAAASRGPPGTETLQDSGGHQACCVRNGLDTPRWWSRAAGRVGLLLCSPFSPARARVRGVRGRVSAALTGGSRTPPSDISDHTPVSLSRPSGAVGYMSPG